MCVCVYVYVCVCVYVYVCVCVCVCDTYFNSLNTSFPKPHFVSNAKRVRGIRAMAVVPRHSIPHGSRVRGALGVS